MRIGAVTTAGNEAGQSPRSMNSREDFMTLLVAQLRAQDPLKPMDPSEFMNQLAQLQTVAELSTISSLLAQSYIDQRLDGAFALIGRHVTWTDPETGEEFSGRVDRVDLTDGQCRLLVGDHSVSLGSLNGVS